MNSALLLAALVASPAITVQDRVFTKSDTWSVVGGATILNRSDFYTSPGVAIAVTRYLDEVTALELQASWFFTYEHQAARDIYAATGFVQDHGEPRALAGAGARYAFAYGKMLMEASDTVVHFAPELAAHVGILATRQRLAPAIDVGVGVRVRIARRFVGVLEYRVVVSAEPNVVVGQQPMLGIGLLL
jgi:hypothetical protein